MRRTAGIPVARSLARTMLVLAALSTTAIGQPPSDPEKGFLGVLLPQIEVSLAPLVEGRLKRIHVRIGDRVGENAVLAEIDEGPIQTERAEAAGRLEEARSAETEAATRLTMSQEALARLKALADQRIVSAQMFSEAMREEELAQATLKRARAKVQQEMAAMDRLETRLSDTRVLAPFAGRVVETYAVPGTSVTPDRPIVRLISDGELWVRFAVPVQAARTMTVGRPIRVSVPDAGIGMKGMLKQAGPVVDPASGMIIYEAVVQIPPGWDGPPLAGQAVRVHPE